MNKNKRENLKKRIIERHSLYKLQHSRLQRLIKDPFRTFFFYILQTLAYIHPFKVTKKTLWGAKMSYYLPEASAIYYYGFFEANLTNFFINTLKEGDVFFDIGAHVGFYTVLASELVGKTGEVHSFEPTPRTYTSLNKNALTLENVITNNVAALDKETTIDFVDYGPKYSAFNSYKKRDGRDTGFLKKINSVSVQTISIDRYSHTKDLKPDFIKIDAEGAEHLILKSMDHVLENVRPVISIEVAGYDEWQENCSKSINLLLSKGYDCFSITLDGLLEEHTPQDFYVYDNLIFVHKDKISRVNHIIKSQIIDESKN